ncbi:hypothetical protein CLAIMM_12737 isoform 2 [Cladophialophora immunda]|nr:hypothetical protein CLAIMM_12737 isoform 2 [Cladophialophora immunda]
MTQGYKYEVYCGNIALTRSVAETRPDDNVSSSESANPGCCYSKSRQMAGQNYQNILQTYRAVTVEGRSVGKVCGETLLPRSTARTMPPLISGSTKLMLISPASPSSFTPWNPFSPCFLRDFSPTAFQKPSLTQKAGWRGQSTASELQRSKRRPSCQLLQIAGREDEWERGGCVLHNVVLGTELFLAALGLEPLQ